MNKTIYLNAGHSDTDPGAISAFGKEADFTKAIRDKLIPELKRCGIEVVSVPDSVLTLKESIKWVNERVKGLNDGLAFSIHLNAGGGQGAETFYFEGSTTSRRIAKTIIDEYCLHVNVRNRGPKPDTQSKWGRLGWIRNTNCWATLIECGFIDYAGDVNIVKDFDNTAKAICKGICKVFEISYIKEESSPENKGREEIKNQIIELVKKL